MDPPRLTIPVTRFAVISERSEERTGRDKTTLMLRLPNQAGALAKAIAPFEKNGVNLTWIESFPTSDGPTDRDRRIIEVADNGRGIAPSDHDRIFELFRRAGAQDQPGEGIGLAHVRALVYRLGGTIDVASALGEGTVFTLSLPAQLSDSGSTS